MGLQTCCKTCLVVEELKNLVKHNVESCVNVSKLNDKLLDIEAANETRAYSFNDIRDRLDEDYPAWNKKLISIPSASLLSYAKKVPYCITEDDVKNYLNGQFKEVLQNKRDELESSTLRNVLKNLLKRFRKGKLTEEKALELLNENILDIIFLGEDSKLSCRKCDSNARCPSKTCPVKKGFCTRFEIFKEPYQNQWKHLLSCATDEEDILEFAVKELEANIKKYLSSSPEFSLLSSVRSQKYEIKLT